MLHFKVLRKNTEGQSEDCLSVQAAGYCAKEVVVAVWVKNVKSARIL